MARERTRRGVEEETSRDNNFAETTSKGVATDRIIVYTEKNASTKIEVEEGSEGFSAKQLSAKGSVD